MPWQNNGDGDKPNPWGNNGGGGPRRGGGGGEPPQIDEFIKKGQEQFKQVMPSGFGGVGLILLVAIVLWLLSGFYQVDSGSRGVVLRFGEYVRATGAGYNWHVPYPIETVEVLDVERNRILSMGSNSGRSSNGRSSQFRSNLSEGLMLTGDENIVDIQFNVVWNIKVDDPLAPKHFLYNIRNPEHTIRMVAQGAIREVVGKTPIDLVIKEGKEAVQTETLSRIQETLDSYESGINIISVDVTVADPPQVVIEFFNDVQKADLDRETYKNEAEAYARKIVPEAEGAAARVQQQAEAYRAQTVARAEGDAARFLSVYEQYIQAKDVTRKRLYLETMEQILAGMDKVILDSNGSGAVPYLPLNELKKKGN